MKSIVAIAALSVAILASSSVSAQHGTTPKGKMQSAAELDPQVKKLEQAAAKLQKQSMAKPKDAALKLAVAEAYFKAGYAAEYSKGALPPSVRYRTALKHYRTALNFNPKHEKAKREKAQIEMIYRQMGRPVPG